MKHFGYNLDHSIREDIVNLDAVHETADRPDILGPSVCRNYLAVGESNMTMILVQLLAHSLTGSDRR